jgi:hypothetical protein
LKIIIAGDIITDRLLFENKKKNYATTLCIEVIFFDDNKRRKYYLSLMKIFPIDYWFDKPTKMKKKLVLLSGP